MFKLLRYFSLTSLASITVAVFLLGTLYRHIALGNLLEMGERSNVALSNSLANSLRAEFAPLLGGDAGGTDTAQLAQTLSHLNARVVEYTRGMSVVKVKIYDLRGKTVFSSDPKQIGEDKSANPGFQAAMVGQPASELSHRDKFSAFEQVIVDRDLLSSYVPIWRGQQQVHAVFEVYDDVTPLLAQLATTQAQIIAGVVLVLGGLYGVLFAVVRRADHILHAQHADLLRHKDELEGARETLEHRVRERTTALEDVNAKLKAEVRQRREAEQELIEARRIAEAASHAKSQFLSAMSHEIRTPLNGVLGMAELLQHTRLDTDQSRYVGAIASSGCALHALLGDILDLAKIEEGEVQLEHIDFDLASLLSEILDIYSELASTRGLVLVSELQATGAWVNGDSGRLRQVVSNLLGNATKFTARGEVRFRSENLPARAGDRRTWQRFTVEDTGMGIAGEAMDKLFQRFSQADDSTTRKFGGSGLGLVICKHLIELMGGNIQVHSAPGQGSRFWFDLPFDPATAPHAAPHAATQGAPKALHHAGVRILLAEDSLVNQQVIKGLLGHLGAAVTVADNGELALEQFRQGRFDLVLMDCQMPVMDGFEAARRIQAWEQNEPGRSPTPIVALTANALAGDRAACLAAGMSDYLAKPITMASLARTVGRNLPDLLQEATLPRVPAAGQSDPAAAFDPSVLNALPMVADGSDTGFADQILELFVERAKTALDTIDQAVLDRDLASLERSVHTLKSSAAQVGAMALSAQAERQELLLRAGAPAQANWPALLRQAFDEFELALGRHRPAAGPFQGELV